MSDLGNLASLDAEHQSRLAPLRRLILETAAQTKCVGEIAESLKWGEPSYTPAKQAIGSSVRLSPRKDGSVALHFICHTGLINEFRELYPHLIIEGKRGIIVDLTKPLPVEELRHCIAKALTYFMK